MVWLQVMGWIGSALLVYSILQSRVIRLRILNLSASAILAVFNGFLGVWPMVAMNVVLVLINTYFLVTMRRAKANGQAFEWLRLNCHDGYVQRIMKRWGSEIETFHPGFGQRLTQGGIHLALIFHGEASIGLVAFVTDADGVSAELLADYVVDQYRDYAPGKFVYAATGPLAAAGLRTIRCPRPTAAIQRYLQQVGFTDGGGGLWQLTLPAAKPVSPMG